MVIHGPDGRHVTGSKRWRLSCGMKVGGEVVSRLEEKCCGQRVRPGAVRRVLLSVSLEAFGLCRCVWFVCVCGRVEGVRLLPRVVVRWGAPQRRKCRVLFGGLAARCQQQFECIGGCSVRRTAEATRVESFLGAGCQNVSKMLLVRNEGPSMSASVPSGCLNGTVTILVCGKCRSFTHSAIWRHWSDWPERHLSSSAGMLTDGSGVEHELN